MVSVTELKELDVASETEIEDVKEHLGTNMSGTT